MKKMNVILAAAFAAASLPVSAQIDPVLSLQPTAEVMSAGQKAEAKAIGIMAYEWGYPLVRMEKVIRTYTDTAGGTSESSFRAPANNIGWSRRLPGYMDADMPTANNDTYYMSAVLILDQPFKVTVPDTDDRYYVINVFDMYHNLTAYIGRRTTGTEAGEFWIVPPGYEGRIPGKKNNIIRPGTDKVWLWGRIQVNEVDDIDYIHSLQDQFRVEPLNPVRNTLPEWENHEGNLAFYHDLAQAMKYNRVFEQEKALAGMFAKIGIKDGRFHQESLTPAQLAGLEEAAAEGPQAIVSNIFSATEERQGWQYARNLSDFGSDYGLRALVSGPYLGGQGAEEAMYPIRYTDDEGVPLEGKNSYRVHFSSVPEVDAFWSLTVYDAESKLLIKNEIGRYKVSSTTPGLKYGSDGSLDIYLSSERPEDISNWLPVPEGRFYLLLRCYQPSEDVLDGTYRMPSVERL